MVYLSISGVGPGGPYAKTVYNPVIQALSGFTDIQADPLSHRPKMIALIADKTTAVYAAAVAALLARERTGTASMLKYPCSTLWYLSFGQKQAPLTKVGQEDFNVAATPMT